MAFIDSVFGSSSKTKKTTKYDVDTTTITKTNTTNTIGDIGLTGEAANQLAANLGISAENLLSISGGNQLAGLQAASQTLRDVAAMNTVNVEHASNYATAILSGATESGRQLLSSAKMQSESLLEATVGATQSENKYLIPYILIGIVGVIFAMKGLK